MSETALAIAKDYPTDKYNLLIPVKTMQELSPLHKMVINEVQIDPSKESKDTYTQNGELALTKKALMKLMAAANIQVVDSHTVPTQRCNKCIEIARVTHLAPKCSDCTYIDDIAVQVTVAVPEPSGTYRMIRATKELRMEDEKAKMSEKEFAQFRKFKTEHCESKALNRALREGLMIKSTYTLNELKKPFIVGLVMPNMADPDLKKAMIEKISNNAAALYGTPGVAQIPAGQPAAALPEYGNMTVIDSDDESEEYFETGEIENAGTDVIDVTPPQADTGDAAENQELLKGIEIPENEVWISCEGEECGGAIESFTDASGTQWAPVAWAAYTKKLTGRSLCVKCFLKWQKEQKAAKAAEEKAKKGAEK